MMWGYNDWSWWAWLLMSAGMIVFWGLVAYVVVWAVRSSRDSVAGTPDARTILAERFARGEIDEDEYRARLETLRGAARSSTPTPGP